MEVYLLIEPPKCPSCEHTMWCEGEFYECINCEHPTRYKRPVVTLEAVEDGET